VKRWTLLLLLLTPVFSQEIYDLLLKGGHVIDPKNKRDGRMDIAITKGRIRKMAKSIPAVQARKVVELGDYTVTPGFIDLNANFDTRTGSNGVNPDHNELRSCVTTAVDSGSAGPANFADFQAKVIKDSKTRVLSFLNPGDDPQAAAALIAKNPQLIVGLRVMPGQSPDAAVRAAELSKTILIGDGPGLRAGDIQTRLYRSGKPAPAAKGVVYDLGHGADGFWFRVAAPAIQKGQLPDTISTGIDKNSIMLPRATMTNVMTKLLALGVPLPQLVERATANPAKAIRRTDIGSLEEGGIADIAVLETRAGAFGLLDSGHARLNAKQEVRCIMTLRNGSVAWDSEGLSVTYWRDAGPYSNFK